MRRTNPAASAMLSAALLAASLPAAAHVAYYDLNQGRQISDLTAAGKTQSTAQYGSNLAVPGASGVNGVSDRPLNAPALWTSANQVTTGVGVFSAVLYTPTVSSAKVVVDDVTDNGWGNGSRATLGDSHRVDFFNFRIRERAAVTISWTVDDRLGNFFDGGFSLYGGVLAYQGHDNAADVLNPKGGFPPHRLQNPFDTGTVFDAQGIASAFRNTLTNTADYAGQFNALGDWGQANGAGNWSNIHFLAGVNASKPVGGVTTSASAVRETLVIELDAGNYTVAAAGALGAPGSAVSLGLSGLRGVLDFHAVSVVPAPVPIPPPAALMVAALCILTPRRRRSH